MIKVVNMIPNSLSGETQQDSEPNLAIDPSTPSRMVGTAFTPAPAGGTNAPVYVSTDGGTTWSLNMIVPGNSSFAGTGDITVAFGGAGTLYAGTLNGSTGELNLLRTADPTSPAAMTLLEHRGGEDQPWVVAGTATVGGGTQDRVYVGNNDFNQPGGRTATVDLSTDARTAAPPANFSAHRIENGSPSMQDGPPVRQALHPDGTVYAAFERWTTTSSFPNFNFDVVVTRDDSWGSGSSPFQALGAAGHVVASGKFARWNDVMGQERIGADLAVAVDPAASGTLYLAYCDRVGGASGTDWTLHVVRSTDRGQSWSNDLRTITNAKNPALAISSTSQVGLLYQRLASGKWTTVLELTTNAWSSSPLSVTLHTASATAPTATFQPYIGDYVRLLTHGTDFFGVFSGNNTPDPANFPSGVVYHRNANWTTHTLLNTDNSTPVAVSIDPFFFHWSPQLIIGPVSPQPVARLPIQPIQPIQPVSRLPISPIDPGPIRTQEGGGTVDL